jgi:glycosyltransferase involved in cell wall biosynthesis
MAVVDISVVVCTRNRAHAILGCLDSIAASTSLVNGASTEIVVVDNGSSDGTSEIVRRWASTASIPLALIYAPREGLAIARNVGIEAAGGQLLVFTDDDCRLSVKYFRDLIAHDAAENEPILWGGRVELGDSTDLPFAIKTGSEAQRWHNKTNRVRGMPFGAGVIGCNMAMRRDVLKRVGPFDERFGTGTLLMSSEDTDFVYRAYRAGIAIAYVPDMVVYHFHGRKDVEDAERLLRAYHEGNGALFAKYIMTDFEVVRQIHMDIINAIIEFVGGKMYIPEYNISYRKKISWIVCGMMRFVKVSW